MASLKSVNKLDNSIKELQKKIKGEKWVESVISDLKFVRLNISGSEYPKKPTKQKNNRIKMADRPVSILETLPVNVRIILENVCYNTGVSTDDVLGNCRKREISEARHMSMYLCFYNLVESPSIVGKWHNRDHSIMYKAIENVEILTKNDKKYKQLFDLVSESVKEKLKP